jgi:ABC-2 type transport system permease protein
VFLKNSAQNEAAYRVNLVVNVLLAVVGVGASLGGVLVLYSHTDTIRGWTLTETLALLGVFAVMNGLVNSFIGPNLDGFAEQVRLGTLDFTLLKPASSQFLVSFRQCNLWGLTDVALGLGVIGYALLSGFGRGVGPLELAAFAVTAASGTAIVYALWLSFGVVAFWTVKIDNMTTILRAFFSMGRFPVDMYPTWLGRLLTYVLPVAFVTTVPVQALSGRAAPLTLGASVLVAPAALWLSARLWRFGLSRYTSASS